MTDEHDPFFLYSLYMSEEDYQTLRMQQGLLVDFNSFGQRFVDLLFACEKDERSDNPKFQLQLYSKDSFAHEMLNANLNVVELNQFKHLVHLSLCFTPGNDSDVKKYMATCWQTLKEEHSRLMRVYEETKFELSQKLHKTEEMLQMKSTDFDKLRVDYDSQSERILAKHMQELSFERDKAMQTQHCMQQKWEKERKEMEQASVKQVKQLEARVNELELANKDLVDKKYKLEAQFQDLRSKYTAVQEEHANVKDELNGMRKQNTSLDTKLYENEKTISHLRNHLNALEVEHKSKCELLAKNEELFANEQTARKQLDDMLKEKSNELKKKQAEINHYHQEFKKGSEAITKLQNKLKEMSSKLTIKSRTIAGQEKVIGEKDKEIEALKSEIKEMKSKIGSLLDENKDLKASLQKKAADLDEAHLATKKSEDMINWLYKQLNEMKTTTSTTGLQMDSMRLSDISNQFKPIGKLQANDSGAFTQFHSTSNNATKTVSETLNGSSRGGYQLTYTNRYSSHDQENLDLSTQPAQMLSNRMPPIQQQQQQPPTSSSSSSSSSSNQVPAARLDPKYFQTSASPPGALFDATLKSSTQRMAQLTSSSAVPLLSASHNPIDSMQSTTTTTIKPLNNSAKPNLLANNSSTGTTSSSSMANNANNGSHLTNGILLNGLNSARLNKQLITQPTMLAQQPTQSYAALISSKSTPTIASAYFPPS